MAFLRAFFLLLLMTSGGFFLSFVITGQQRHKQRGLQVLRWTLVAGAVFFAVLILDRVL